MCNITKASDSVLSHESWCSMSQTCLVLFLENIKQAKWFSQNGSFLKSTIFSVLKDTKHANGFWKWLFHLAFCFGKISSSVNDFKWVFFELDNFCCGKENIFKSIILNGWVFFSIGQFCFGKENIFKSIILNGWVFFSIGQFCFGKENIFNSMILNGWVFFSIGQFFCGKENIFKSMILNAWVFFSIGQFCFGKDYRSQMVES